MFICNLNKSSSVQRDGVRNTDLKKAQREERQRETGREKETHTDIQIRTNRRMEQERTLSCVHSKVCACQKHLVELLNSFVRCLFPRYSSELWVFRGTEANSEYAKHKRQGLLDRHSVVTHLHNPLTTAQGGGKKNHESWGCQL